mmetsp:Transcript_24824/g.54492  ORF Transcript_24824/g.54492 Transcript_24824/m.54492 type:complete len:211 (+) Transcript_24824:997-1629(+)
MRTKVFVVSGIAVLPVFSGSFVLPPHREFMRAVFPLLGLPRSKSRNSRDGSIESGVGSRSGAIDFLLPRPRLLVLISSVWPNRKSSARVVSGEITEIACQRPIQSKKVSGVDTRVALSINEMSTEGKVSLLIIVIPLAERDGEIPRGDDVLPVLSDVGNSEYGIIGRLKESPNNSLDRIGCHGGNEGSGMIEKIASISSKESTPSWSESN